MVTESLIKTDDQLACGVMERVAAKWPLSIMRVLAQAKGPLRFSRVLERVEGISQKVLTHTLRSLERDGLVTRTLYPQVPPRVEYELTPLGGDVLAQVVSLLRWIAGRLENFTSVREPGGDSR
jgi:DNA-binding HxlR family transcriptional regulator